MTLRWNKRHQMPPNHAAKPCLGSYPRSVESKSVIRSRHVFRSWSTSTASRRGLNHAQTDGDREVETESQESSVDSGERITVAEDEECGASHPGNQSREH